MHSLKSNIIEYGIHEWSFKLDKVKIENDWRSTIGLWRIQESNKSLPLNTVYCDGMAKGYGFIPGEARLIGTHNGRASGPEYGKVCNQGTIIDMIVDMNKLELSYRINGKKYGKAYDITEDKYRAAVNMYDNGDMITLL